MYIADALGATDGAAVGEVVVVLYLYGIFKTRPFVLGEEIAEIGLADVGGFVSAERLHGIGVVGIEGESGGGILL